ncbi:MAG: signal peptidase I [Clostridiales bacterium]|nr:signal peptidase I [Clostridiales bacterium]
MSEKTMGGKAVKTAKKVAAQIVRIILLLILLFNIALSFVLGFEGFCVKNDSMYPFIKKGSLVLTKPIDFQDIHTNDVLTFYDSNTSRYFTHRVVRIFSDSQQLVTKGDVNKSPDPKTTHYSCVKGKVVHVLPFAGYPYAAVNSLPGTVILSAALIFWAAFEIEGLRTGKKGETRE